MNWGIIIFIVCISGLVIIGIIKNLWTCFAVLCLTGFMVFGVVAYNIWAMIQINSAITQINLPETASAERELLIKTILDCIGNRP